MKVFCYFHDPSVNFYPREIMQHWANSFADNGFKPVILTEEDALKNPLYRVVSDFADRMPTINGAVYERACWMRWLAYAMAGEGLFTDYDVINFGFKPEEVNRDVFVSLDPHPSPGCFYAETTTIKWFISQFNEDALRFAERIDGKLHLSDLILFRHWFQHMGFPIQPVCWCMEHQQADTAKLRHFSNLAMPPEFKYNNRHKLIARMLADPTAKLI